MVLWSASRIAAFKHDGGQFRSDGSNFWWIHYRDRDGQRRPRTNKYRRLAGRQKQLRERLQAKDNKTLVLIRKGEELTVAQWADFFLEKFYKPPIRTEKTLPLLQPRGKPLENGGSECDNSSI